MINSLQQALKTTSIRNKIGTLSMPLLAILSGAIAVSLLISVKYTLLVFAAVTVPIVIFAEPFAGAMLYLASIYVRPFDTLPIPSSIPVMKILGGGALAAWLLNMLIHRRRISIANSQDLLMFLLLLTMIASQRGNIHRTLDSFSDFSKIVIIYFLLVNLVNTHKRLEIAIWVLMASTFYIALQGYLLSKGISIGGIKTVGLTDVDESLGGFRVQSTGIFGDPNDMAMTMVVAVPLAFEFFFFERFALKKALLAVFGFGFIYSTLLTVSRGGMIGLGVVAFFIARKKLGIILGTIGVVIVGLIFMNAAPSYIVERAETISTKASTAQSRIEAWKIYLDDLKSSPILGMGMNNIDTSTAHNSFVHIGGELGLVGLYVWLGLFYMAFKHLRRATKSANGIDRYSRTQIIAGSLQTSLIGFVVCASFLSRQYNWVPYILLALSSAASRIGIQEPLALRKFSKTDLVIILALVIGFLCIWQVSVRIFL